MNEHEQGILTGLQKGNEIAYQSLFNEYYELLVSFALKYVKSLDLAREMVQLVFITLFDKRKSIRITSSIRNYLQTAVYHQCLAELKRDGRFIEPIDESSVESRDFLEEAEDEARIWRAINGLPTECRKIFVMNRLEGLKNQMIADELGISKRTVETQISKALKALREKLLNLLAFVRV